MIFRLAARPWSVLVGVAVLSMIGSPGCGRLLYDPLSASSGEPDSDAGFRDTAAPDGPAGDAGPMEDATRGDSGLEDAALVIDSGELDSGSPDSGSSSIPEPLARYRINEAIDGQVPTEVLDDTTSAFHLPLSYVAGSPFYEEGVDGNRLLRFAGPQTSDTGGARREMSGTGLNVLHGATAATLEVKYTVDGCTNSDHRIFGVSNGDDPPTAGWLLIREDDGVELLAVRWSAFDVAAAYRFEIGCPFVEPREPAIVQWVIDTQRPVEEDRVRAYVDGVRQSVSPTSGLAAQQPFPPQGATIDLVAEEVTPPTLVLGTEATSFRTANTRIWYAAIYDVALTDAQISVQAARLASTDD